MPLLPHLFRWAYVLVLKFRRVSKPLFAVKAHRAMLPSRYAASSTARRRGMSVKFEICTQNKSVTKPVKNVTLFYCRAVKIVIKTVLHSYTK